VAAWGGIGKRMVVSTSGATGGTSGRRTLCALERSSVLETRVVVGDSPGEVGSPGGGKFTEG